MSLPVPLGRESHLTSFIWFKVACKMLIVRFEVLVEVARSVKFLMAAALILACVPAERAAAVGSGATTRLRDDIL